MAHSEANWCAISTRRSRIRLAYIFSPADINHFPIHIPSSVCILGTKRATYSTVISVASKAHTETIIGRKKRVSAHTCWQICHKKKSFLLLLVRERPVFIEIFFPSFLRGCSCRLLCVRYWQTYIKCSPTLGACTYRNARKFCVPADESFSAGRCTPLNATHPPRTAIGIESGGNIYTARLPQKVFALEATRGRVNFWLRMVMCFRVSWSSSQLCIEVKFSS